MATTRRDARRVSLIASGARTLRTSSKNIAVCVLLTELLAPAILQAATAQDALRLIRAADLRRDLSYLASDALAGRYTPSPGLETAAQFIAAQFRAAGLEPITPHGYFQLADMVDRRLPNASGLKLQRDGQTWTVRDADVQVLQANAAQTLGHVPLTVLAARDPGLLRGLDLKGKAVIVAAQPSGSAAPEQSLATHSKRRAFDRAVANSGAALEILVERYTPKPAHPKLLTAEEAQEHRPIILSLVSSELLKWTEHPGNSVRGRTVSLSIGAPVDRKVQLKNVAGLLRGTDPQLKSTFVLLTAHYDHIGTTATGRDLSPNRTQNPNDHVYNGANDDGSGTVSVIEIARAIAKAGLRPKRSIVFLTFFGEERGEVGSAYYGAHPLVPIPRTVADVNLEQLGRTDSTIGRELARASLTGFDYSEVPGYFERAGRETGVTLYLDKTASDVYFTRSDNDALAERGIPAHTLCVAFDYPDYHGLGDEWQKIDYENMAHVDRMIALGLWDLANSTTPPQWNARNPKTVPFREARGRDRIE